MTEAVELFSALTIEVPRREVLRNLGYPRAHRPAARIERALERVWPQAAALVQPRGALRLVSAEQAHAAGMPTPTPLVGLGLVTIGPALEAREEELSSKGDLLEALLFDAYGSAAAEAAADALNLLLCHRAQRRGLTLPPRISPGYGSWEMEGQRTLLPLLGAEALGVRLTRGLMMVPRKSISFAARMSKEGGHTRVARQRCASCELTSCAYRREPEDVD